MQALNKLKPSNSISHRDKSRLNWITSQPIEEAQKHLFAYTENPPFSLGRKYDRETIELWARSEPPEVRDIILELYRRQFDDCELDLVRFLRGAIASNDGETAKQIQEILKEVCGSGYADRHKVWAALSESEQSAFKALLAIESKPAAPTDSSIATPVETLLEPNEFHHPKHPPINFDVPIVMLEPETPDYNKHLFQISEAKLLVLDIETFGDYPNAGLHPRDAKIRLIQLFDGVTVWIADLKGHDLNKLPLFAHLPSERDSQQMKLRVFFDILAERLNSKDCLVIGHNLHFDLRILRFQLGFKAQKISCTKLGFQVYFGDYSSDSSINKKYDPLIKGGYGLANLCKLWFDTKLDKSEQTSDWGVSELSKSQIKYAAKDVIATYYLYQALLKLYADTNLVLYSPTIFEAWQVENNCLTATVEIELTGMPLDRALAIEQVEKLTKIKSELLTEWSKVSPEIFYTQNTQFGELLKSKYNIQVDKVDKAELTEHLHIPEVRLRGKLKAIDVLLNNVQGFMRAAQHDGKVHTVYSTLTGFGRFSSGESKHFEDLPNLQSISAKKNPLISQYNLPSPRETIRPPKGYTMAVIDLAGAHGRIAADQADDATAIAGNNDPTVDNHSKVAVYVAKTQKLEWTWQDIARLKKEKTEEGLKANALRSTAKNTYFGWLNGAGAERIQNQIAANEGYEPDLTDCMAAIEGCKKLYPAVLKHRKALHDKLRQEAITIDGRLVAANNTSDGFRLLLPLVKNKFTDRMEAPYSESLASIWSRIEATAVKRALPKIQTLIEANPHWNLQIIGIVHDELDILVKTEFEEIAIVAVNNIVGDKFQAQLKKVSDGRETDWKKLKVSSWADK